MSLSPNNLSLRQLRAFEAVARLGSFAAAAAEQCVTQSALSESVKQLEAGLGLRLLDRTTRHVALSAAGALFIDDVRHVLATLRNGQQRLLELRTLAAGHIRVAGSPSVLSCLVLPVLEVLLREHPGLQATVCDASADRIVQMVQAGEIDFGVGALPAGTRSAQDLVRRPLLADRFGLVAPVGHPLLERKGLRLADLRGERCVGLIGETAIAQMISRLPGCPAALSRPVALASNPSVLRQMIDAGIGVALLPALVARAPTYRHLGFNLLQSGRTRMLERQTFLLLRPGRGLAPAAEALWQAMRPACAALAGQPGLTIARDL